MKEATSLTVYMVSGNQITTNHVKNWSMSTDSKTGKITALEMGVHDYGSIIRQMDLSRIEAVVENIFMVEEEGDNNTIS